MNNKKIIALTSLTLAIFLFFGFLMILFVSLNNSYSILPASHVIDVESSNFILSSENFKGNKLLIKYKYLDGSESNFRYVPFKIQNKELGSLYSSNLISTEEKVKQVEVFNWLNFRTDIRSRDIEKIISRNEKNFERVLGLNSEIPFQTQILITNGFNVINKESWSGKTEEQYTGEKPTSFSGIEIELINTIEQTSDVDRVQKLYSYSKYSCSEIAGFAPEDCSIEETLDNSFYHYIITEDGTVFEGNSRLSNEKTLETKDTNNLSVVFLVNGDSPLTDAQFKTGSKLVGLLFELNDIKIDALTIKNTERSDLKDLSEQILKKNKSEGILKESLLKVEEITENNQYVVIGNKAQLVLPEELSNVEEQILEAYTGEEIDPGNDKIVYIEESLLDTALVDLNASTGNTLVQPNKIYKLSTWDNSNVNRSIPSDYSQSTHWYLEKIKMPEAWSDLGGCTSDNTCGGSQAVKVAVLDTGVAYENYDYDAGDNFTTTRFDPFWVEVPMIDNADGGFNEGYDRQYRKHPELSNVTFVNPYDSWQDYSCNILRVSGATPDPCNTSELSKISHANDDHGHGTFVTGIIAANTADSAPNLISGIAHNVQIVPVKVFTPNDRSMCLDSNGNVDLTCSYANGDYRSVAFTTTLVYGINHAVSNGAKVINMSLGGPGSDPLVENAINNAVNSDVLVVVASGNDNDDANYYFPANSPGAFTVGATTPTDTRASYSNYGSVIDIVAPVGDSSTSKSASVRYICSTTSSCWDESNPNIFQSFTSTSSPNTGIGTSYAAPQVAAAAGLIKSYYPSYTMNQVANSLTSTATDLGATGFDNEFGYGLLNVEAALGVDEPIEEPPITPDPPTDPQQTSNDLYFTWYDTTSNNKAWVLVGNPSTTQTASVNIRIGSAINANYNIPPGGRVTPYWPNILAGPVVITSNLPIYASQRVIFGGSFNEMSGIKASELSTKYYFTWYDSSSPTIRTWILVGNPSTSQTASVTIKIGGAVVGGYNIGPGGVVTPLYNGLINGPVEITSNINVYATQRVLFEGSFNEVSGIVLD